MNQKSLQRALVAIAVMFCSWLPSLAQDFYMGIFSYNILSEEDNTVEICGVLDKSCVSVEVSPMVKYNGENYSVVAIGKHAFYECSKLETVELCSTIKTIDYAAFGYCESLTSIDIPKAVETIGEYAFYNCTKLASVTLGSSVKTIGTQAFYGCESLTSIDIPDLVETIGEFAFYNCSALKSVMFGASVQTIGDQAFWGCYELSEVYSCAMTPPVCTGIFEQETVMCTLFVPTGYKAIYSNTFPWSTFWTIQELDSLTQYFEIGNLKYEILSKEDNTVAVCGVVDKNCENVEVSSMVTYDGVNYSVVEIGKHAFYECSKLVTVKLCSTIKTIDYAAFSYCKSLTYIEIPNSVETIGEFAFYDCTRLTIIKLGSSLKTIGSSAFAYCEALDSIDIPDSIETIDEFAFYDCTKLATVTLGSSLKTIGSGAFAYCRALVSIKIPNSVETIGKLAFSGCSSLPSIEIPNKVTSIEEETFCDCTKLATVTLGSSLKTIGSEAFWGCKSLTSLKIPNSVETIGKLAFHYCYGLEMLDFGVSVQNIGENAFMACYMTEVYSRATTPPVCVSNFEPETFKGTLFVPVGYKAIYAETFPWNKFNKIQELHSLSVEGVATDEVEVKAVGGSIVFGGATEATIYSSAGILVASGVMTEVELPAGLYIVVAGGKSHKVIVK